MFIDGKLNFEVGGHVIQIDHDAFTTAGSIFLRHKNSNNFVPIDIAEAWALGNAIIRVASVAAAIQQVESGQVVSNNKPVQSEAMRDLGVGKAAR